jgi:hypothetical protein
MYLGFFAYLFHPVYPAIDAAHLVELVSRTYPLLSLLAGGPSGGRAWVRAASPLVCRRRTTERRPRAACASLGLVGSRERQAVPRPALPMSSPAKAGRK